MKTLRRLILLTHPMAYQGFAGQPWAQPWIDLELAMERRWLAALAALRDGELAGVVSAHPRGPAWMETFCERAEQAGGERCVILRERDARSAEFWQFEDRDDENGCLDDLRGAWVGQGDAWNREEMDTMLHARRCAVGLRATCRQRGVAIDPRRTVMAAWGEEFEGCTLKYALAMRRALKLAQPPRMEFDLCVPGSRPLMHAKLIEQFDIAGDVQAMVFSWRGRSLALFLSLRSTLVDRPQSVVLPRELRGVTVRNKQGGRLWPMPMRGRSIKGAPLGFGEPARPLVNLTKQGLEIPVCTGMVYALAKAPALVIAPPSMSMRVFAGHLRRARI